MSDSANVFVSHIHEDDEHIDRLKGLLSERGFNIRDASINASRPNNAKDPDYIKREILAPRIEWAGTMVVLVSAETKDSDYVPWEIEYAAQHDKRIVGVFTRGSADSDLPDGLEDYADAIVAWNGDAVLEAVRGTNIWQNSDGARRPPRDIARHNC